MTAKKRTRRSTSKGKKRRQTAAKGSTHRTGLVAGPSQEGEDDGYLADWASSRHGAYAARGFHFQDAVGAWLAVQVADGTIEGVLVPEGFDDMTIEATEASNVQIKSRVLRRGQFSPQEAAEHVVEAWATNQSRSVPAPTIRVVCEHGVNSTEDLQDPRAFLRSSLEAGSPLELAVQAAARKRRITGIEFEQLLDNTVVVGRTWDQLDEETYAHLGNLIPGVEREGHRLIARTLRIEVAEATDTNANPDYSQRAVLDRTAIIAHIHSTTEQIDVASLNAAISEGICSTFDPTVGADAGDRFYEGESTTPGHVSSGLVVTRSDLVTEVLAGIHDDRPVVITGPSGVGKSALLWTIPLALRGVAWFRVQRLQTAADANLLLRLARAHGASTAHPIGFLLDGAGAGELTGWEQLRSQAQAQAGVLLVATARNEDLVALGSLAGTTTVAVNLNEAAAATIFNGLKRRGVTTAPHWREAFEQSRGLTLEFTYLLTQGRRLQEVIADQIKDRVNERRDHELDLLALVAVAHQWSTTLDLDTVAQAVTADSFDLRRTIDRLADEHLLVETDGVLSGLHPVRSAAITTAIHSRTYPTLKSTVDRVIDLIDDRQLPRFISQALREHPELADVVLNRGEATTTTTRLAAFLHGLRLTDDEMAIRQWIDIMRDQQIPPSTQLTVIMWAIANMDLGDLTPEPLRAALDQMAAIQPGTLRDQLADHVGPATIGTLLFSATPHETTELVATLFGWQQSLPLPVHEAPAPALLEHLRNASLDTIAEMLATFRTHDRDLHRYLIAQLGGEEHMLTLLRDQNPWLLELDIRREDHTLIGYARVLHVSDDLQADPRERCLALARLLLRFLPSIDRPDVEALLPGGRSMEIAGHVHGVSRLDRRYDHSSTEVAWNQARSALAQAIIGVPDTIRLATAYPLLRDLAGLVREVANRWTRSDATRERTLALAREAGRLDEAARQMPPSLGEPNDPGSISETRKASIGDPLSYVITDFTDLFRQLGRDENHAGHAMQIRDTLLKHLRQALEQKWHLIAEGDQAVENLNQLATDAQHIHDVLMALDGDPNNAGLIRSAARGGSIKYALQRSADSARRLRTRTIDERRQELGEAVVPTMPDADVTVLADERDGFTHYAILVNVPTLLGWGEVEARIVETLGQRRQLMEQFLILPIRNGKRIEGFGLNLINEPLPAPTVGEWETLLPEAHVPLLAQNVAAAIQALRTLSGLADLTDVQRAHPDVAAVAETANHSLTEAVEALSRRENDRFTQEILTILGQLKGRVDTELDGTATTTALAAALALGQTGQPTEEWTLLTGMWVCAIEWEIDPDIVVQVLDWNT